MMMPRVDLPTVLTHSSLPMSWPEIKKKKSDTHSFHFQPELCSTTVCCVGKATELWAAGGLQEEPTAEQSAQKHKDINGYPLLSLRYVMGSTEGP